MKQVGTKRIRVPVEYCPVTWLPDMVWVESEAAVHRDWLLAMNELYDRLRRDHFRDHDVVDFGIEPRYVEVDRPVLSDTRRVELDAQFATPEVVVDHNAQGLVVINHSDIGPTPYGVRATTRIK
jgi:hypothetical protein